MELLTNLVNQRFNHVYNATSSAINTQKYSLLLSILFLTACGGGYSNSFAGSESTGTAGSSDGTNSPPVATNVTITDENGGAVEAGDLLVLSYDYSDAEDDKEGTTLFRWYRDDAQISGEAAVKQNYIATSADVGTTLTVRVIPVAQFGITTGEEVFSNSLSIKQAGAVLDPSHFRSLISSNTVSCTLSNGSTTTCHELKFTANDIIDGVSLLAVDDEAGTFCPTLKTDTDGGVGIYDGATGAGFQQLAQTLWDNMVGDGYDIIDDSDNVCTFDLNAGTQANGVQAQCGVNCLINTPDDSITVVHYIPVTPQISGSDDIINEIEAVGTSLDGVPITGSPPSVVARGGNIPALDGCGGHHDPSGYYHWHFVPESADAVLTNFAITGVDCASNITQSATALTGYAKDGYPIYAHLDDGDVIPTGLDSCNGHTGDTVEFPDGVYHYHAFDNTAPNLPPCLKGASAVTPATPSFE